MSLEPSLGSPPIFQMRILGMGYLLGQGLVPSLHFSPLVSGSTPNRPPDPTSSSLGQIQSEGITMPKALNGDGGQEMDDGVQGKDSRSRRRATDRR